jgi:hypothetical protein
MVTWGDLQREPSRSEKSAPFRRRPPRGLSVSGRKSSWESPGTADLEVAGKFGYSLEHRKGSDSQNAVKKIARNCEQAEDLLRSEAKQDEKDKSKTKQEQ